MIQDIIDRYKQLYPDVFIPTHSHEFVSTCLEKGEVVETIPTNISFRECLRRSKHFTVFSSDQVINDPHFVKKFNTVKIEEKINEVLNDQSFCSIGLYLNSPNHFFVLFREQGNDYIIDSYFNVDTKRSLEVRSVNIPDIIQILVEDDHERKIELWNMRFKCSEEIDRFSFQFSIVLIG